MAEDDNEEYELDRSDEGLRALPDPNGGHTLPILLLLEAFGRKSPLVAGAPGICVVVRTKNPAWIKTLARAAKFLGDWKSTFVGVSNMRMREDHESDAYDTLSRGGRVLCVGSSVDGSIPQRLLTTADLVVDIDAVTLRSVSRAIRSVTKGRPRGLGQEDVQSLDLIDAMVAIRPNTTAASCLRRLRACKTQGVVDPFVAAAPAVSELAGYGKAREWADRLVEDLGRWRRGEIPFAAIQRNAVLAGHPGVGKSSFVRSLSKSTGLPLFASSIGQMFANTAGHLDSIVKAIDDLFARARASGDTAIVFLDEIEGIPSRSSLDDRNASWWTPVVNHFLTVLDGAMSSSSSQLIVIGATNHPEKLDPALVRPGRLDRIIWIDLPDAGALAHIYRQHLGADLGGEDLSVISELAIGSTGADVVGHVKSARSNARAAEEALSLRHLADAVCPPSKLPPDALHRAAIHEAGHAVAALVIGGQKIRNMMLGGTGWEGRVTFERDAHSLGSADERRIEVIQILSGRAAEEVLTGSVSAGSGGADHSDLARATRIVAAGRLSFGLGETLAYLAEPTDALDFLRRSPQLLRMVEEELQRHYRSAIEVIRENEGAVTALAEALLRHRTLTGDAVREIVARARNAGPEGHRA